MDPEAELALFDSNNSWFSKYQMIRDESLEQHDYSYDIARSNENRLKNRYGDVSPFDFNRIILKRDNIDYINASRIVHPPSNRAYILAQGPLPHTCGQFWLMVWEQNSSAILMLTKLVEKNTLKCHKYYPSEEDGNDELVFTDVRLKVVFVGVVESNDHFTTRLFKLQDLQTGETKTILHFHYTSWPDFGVPKSPEAFLTFLTAVREKGVLDDPNRQVVIHCSAGIGRTGTFCLVDVCLQRIEQGEEINILNELLELRKYRMGLIQTPEQLRFSYLAIVEGSKQFNRRVLNGTYHDHKDLLIKNVETDINADIKPDMKADINLNSDILKNIISNSTPDINNFENKSEEETSNNDDDDYDNDNDDNEGDNETEILNSDKDETNNHLQNQQPQPPAGTVRRRARDERLKKTSETIKRMQQKQRDAEGIDGRRSNARKMLVAGVAVVAVAIFAVVLYKLG